MTVEPWGCPTPGACSRLNIEAESARIESLEAALRFGVGCAINELVAAGRTPEWGDGSGIGAMLSALGCNSNRLDDDVRALLGAPAEGESR